MTPITRPAAFGFMALAALLAIIATLSDHRRPALVRHGTPGGIHALERKDQKISHGRRSRVKKPGQS